MLSVCGCLAGLSNKRIQDSHVGFEAKMGLGGSKFWTVWTIKMRIEMFRELEYLAVTTF